MRISSKARCLGALMTVLALASPVSVAVGDEACPATMPCVALRDFTASVIDTRISTDGKKKVVTATVRFRNNTDRALILGYVDGSGVATDDRGNRYTVRDTTAVRGMGVISGTSFDSKFELQPGENADARFELSWKPDRGAKPGSSFDFDFTVREIEAQADESLRLGREHALLFAGAGQAPRAAPATAAAVPAVPAASAAPALGPAPAPVALAAPPPSCAQRTNCFDAGNFIAEVAQLRSGQGSHVHYTAVRVTLRIKNTGTTPLILAYKHGSGKMLDEHGQVYTVAHANEVTGIGLATGSRTDAQFQLAPGEARNATIALQRRSVNTPEGSSYSLDLALEQVELMSANSVRTVRQHAVSFPRLSPASVASVATGAGGSAGMADTGGAGEAAQGATDAVEAVQEVGRSLKKLFGRD